MTSPVSIPSISEIEASLKSLPSNDEPLRQIVLQCLSHGTDYDVWPRGPNLPDRTSTASSTLLDIFSKSWPSDKVPEALEKAEQVLVDALWLVGSLTQNDESSLDRLAQLVQSLARGLSPNFCQKLQTSLEPSLLGASGLIQTDVLIKRSKKLNTDLHYRQERYNLMQEESEGYAKVLTILIDHTSSSQCCPDIIRGYIGTFDLDPNRVLDLIIDSLEVNVGGIIKSCGSIQKASHEELDALTPLLSLMQEFHLPHIPHLLGVKYSSYQANGKAPPKSLLVTTTILALKGFFQLSALLPHLSPLEDIVEANRQEEAKHSTFIRKMGVIRLNQSKGQAESREMTSDMANVINSHSVVGLVFVLLDLKAWHTVSEVLSPKFLSALCVLLPDGVGRSICGLVDDMIDPIYKTKVKKHGRLLKKSVNGKNHAKDPEACSWLFIKKTVIDEKNASLDDVIRSIQPALAAITNSGCIQSHPVIYGKLCRLYCALMTEEQEEEVLVFLRSFLIPSLSLFPSNPALSADLWAILSTLPYEFRYQLYDAWRGPGLEKLGLDRGGKSLFLVQAEVAAGLEIRYVLKRLTRDNIRDTGRQVCKASHSNPLVVFSNIMSQVESYDNMIDMMVESLRFATPLSFDVLGYCILVALGGGSKDGGRKKLKVDGVNATQWLSSLETFTGAFYRKFPDVECRGILSYVMQRLRHGHVLELGVLRSLLKTAGGYGFADYTSSASLSPEQLEGRSGSHALKRETSSFGVAEKLDRYASRRMRSTLQSDDMGITILILLAQLRRRLLYRNTTNMPRHIKLIGNLHDTCQIVMGLLLEFLTDTADEANSKTPVVERAVGKFHASLPSVEELYGKYGLDPSVAWMLYRPAIRPLDLADQNFSKSSASTKECYNSILSDSAREFLTMELFEVFNSHDIYDIYVPEATYKSAIGRLEKDVERRTEHQKGGSSASATRATLAAAAAAAGGTEQEIQQAMVFTKADEEELLQTKQILENLSSDLVKQQAHCGSIRKKVEAAKGTLFSELSKDTPGKLVMRTFLAECIYPRWMLSPEDAMYCAHFVMLLHKMETPRFHTLDYLINFVDTVVGALYSVTENEAGNLGIMLNETWKVVSEYRYNGAAYKKESGKSSSCFHQISEKGRVVPSFEEFSRLYSSWHRRLGDAMLGCLQSSEYMHTRAALIALTRIVRVFPTQAEVGEELLAALEPLMQEDNPLQDIKTMAQGYATQLIRARDEGVWKEEDESTARARLEKQKAEQEQRRKLAEERMEQMEKESEEQLARELKEGGQRGEHARRGGMDIDRGLNNADKPRLNFMARQGASYVSSRMGQDEHLRDEDRKSSGDRRDRGERDRRGQDSFRTSSRDMDLYDRNRDDDRGRGKDDGPRRGSRSPTPLIQGESSTNRLEGRWQRSETAVVERSSGLKRGRIDANEGNSGSQGVIEVDGSDRAKRMRIERSSAELLDRKDRRVSDREIRSRDTSPPRGGRSRHSGLPPPRSDRSGGRRADRRGGSRR